jgi:hypothetical protein
MLYWVDARLRRVMCCFVFGRPSQPPLSVQQGRGTGENSMAMCVLESINDGLEYTGTLCINRPRFDIEATLAGTGFGWFQPVLSGVRA